MVLYPAGNVGAADEKAQRGYRDTMRRIKMYGICLAMLLSLLGCGRAGDGRAENGNPQTGSVSAVIPETGEEASDEGLSMVSQDSETSFVPYQAPEFADSAFHADKAEGTGTVKLDLSALSQGYVAVSAESGKRLKFQVLKGDIKYNYNIASDGTPSVFPLQSGDGTYTFKVMENVTEGKYAPIYTAQKDVVLADEFQPFLRPSDYVNYSQDSECVKKAAELAQKAEDALGVVTAVYDYITTNVKYDYPKAESVQSGYLPDVDETLATGKGICFDYASLTAAMLRSQGIPTKMVFGDVSPDDVYHAWNMFYTEETGWVTVKFQVSADSWNRLDLTFSAGGADTSFVGDGNNYTDTSYY